MSELNDVIAAFADGEAVDPARLKAALAVESGRDHLIDLLVLRALIGEPGVARPAVAAPVPAAVSRWRWLPAAAVLAVACAGGGYLAGQRFGAGAGMAQFTAQFVPTGAEAPGPVVTERPGAAPTPTQVIRFERGVDWTEKSGGN